MAQGKNINDSALQKITDFTNELNRLYASATDSTKDGYIIIKELITYILSQVPSGGDMLKSIYDTDDSGVVDDSELINGDTVANDSVVAANTSFRVTPSTIITAGTNLSWDSNTLNADGGSSLWQILTNKLSNILQSVDYISLFAKSVEVVRIGDGTNPKIIVDPSGTAGNTTGYWFGGGAGIYESVANTINMQAALVKTSGWFTVGTRFGIGTVTSMQYDGTGTLVTQTGAGVKFLTTLDNLSLASTFTFESTSGDEMTATNIEQSYMLILPLINQSGTASYNGLKIDATETALGDGSAGDGNNLLNLAIGGVSKFKIDNAGNVIINVIKSGATQAAAGAAANEMWKTSGHATLPDNVIMHGV